MVAAERSARRRCATWVSRTSVSAVAVLAGSPAVAGAASAPTPGVASPAQKSACSLLTHAQVAALLDSSRFSETISQPDHCSWDVAGNSAISNGMQVGLEKVTAANTFVGRSGAAVLALIACASYPLKRIEAAGDLGYYCIYPQPISGGLLEVQKGTVHVSMPINYGVPGDKVNVADYVADAELVIKELTV